MSNDAFLKIKWAGWVIVATVGLSMGAWFAGEVAANGKQIAANGKQIAVIEERQHNQYQQLREDIAELKRLVGQAP